MSQIRVKIPMKNPLLKAFTFIETIVVIAILLILATLLINTFKSARDKALRFSCANNMSHIIRALNLYLEDYPSVDCPPGSSINDIYGSLYYLSKDGKMGGITNMKIYVCPATTHIPLIPLGYGESLKSNWLPANGNTNMTDYLIIKPHRDQYPNFRKTPKGNAVLWEDLIGNHKSGRHVGFWDQRVRFIAPDLSENYPKNLDYSKGTLPKDPINELIEEDIEQRIYMVDK
jgi:hypothetical protein